MTRRNAGTPGRPTRRTVMTSGLAGIAGAVVPQAVSGAGATRAGAPVTVAPADTAWTPVKTVVHRPRQQTPNPLLSACIRSGHLLFVSGIGGWYPDRRKEPGDARVQIESALVTMKASYTGTSADLMGRPGELVQVDCIAYVD